MAKRAHVYVSGLVQGVFYRSSARRNAESLGLTGWVRNLPDGRVEAVFEGEENQVEEMVAWCRKGPPGAEVGLVEVIIEKPTKEFSGFSVRR